MVTPKSHHRPTLAADAEAQWVGLRSHNVKNANRFSYAVLPKSTNSMATEIDKFFTRSLIFNVELAQYHIIFLFKREYIWETEQ